LTDTKKDKRKELSKKYKKTERTLYYDASTRETWQPLYTQLFELDKARLIVMNRYSYIYREASYNYRQGDSSQKPTYLKIMLEVTKNLIELLGLQSVKNSPYQRKQLHETETLQSTTGIFQTIVPRKFTPRTVLTCILVFV
jgi:hypothetical protein